MESLVPYFAYGSNLNRADMALRCPNAHPDVPARLAGWGLTFRGVADIESVENRTVFGALWSLSSADLRCLDRYEGAPTHYRQRVVQVETAHGPREAITYVMCDSTYLGLPSEWYYGRIEAGYRDWGLPLARLERAREKARNELAALGVKQFRPDGRKRLEAVPWDR